MQFGRDRLELVVRAQPAHGAHLAQVAQARSAQVAHSFRPRPEDAAEHAMVRPLDAAERKVDHWLKIVIVQFVLFIQRMQWNTPYSWYLLDHNL